MCIVIIGINDTGKAMEQEKVLHNFYNSENMCIVIIGINDTGKAMYCERHKPFAMSSTSCCDPTLSGFLLTCAFSGGWTNI